MNFWKVPDHLNIWNTGLLTKDETSDTLYTVQCTIICNCKPVYSDTIVHCTVYDHLQLYTCLFRYVCTLYSVWSSATVNLFIQIRLYTVQCTIICNCIPVYSDTIIHCTVYDHLQLYTCLFFAQSLNKP